MENEKQIQEEKKEPSMVLSALEAAKRLEAENLRLEGNLKKLEEFKSFELLGGKSEGRKQEEKPKEVSSKEYAKNVLEGRI